MSNEISAELKPIERARQLLKVDERKADLAASLSREGGGNIAEMLAAEDRTATALKAITGNRNDHDLCH